MKNSLSVLLIVFFASILVVSCDKIEKPYVVQDIVDASCDTPQFQNLGSVYRKILLEEFTGHTCVNCPDGHRRAKLLIDKYQDSIVVIAIHAGVFSQPELPDFPADYRSTVGTALNDEFGVEGYPSGMINRIPFNSTLIQDRTAWSIAANAIDKQQAKAAIQMQCDYNSTDRKACVHSKVTFLQDINANLKLAVYMIEDSIVSPQKNIFDNIGTVPVIEDYVHNHMLRASLNTIWGETITTSIASSGFSVYKGYGFSFTGTAFKPENCSFIAILYDVNSYEVWQVEEIHAISE